MDFNINFVFQNQPLQNVLLIWYIIDNYQQESVTQVLHKHFERIIRTFTIENTRPGGGIGRRKGLKIPREQSRAGSTPALGK